MGRPGRPTKGDKRKRLDLTLYEEEVDAFMDLVTHFGSNNKAMQYLLQVEKQYMEMTGTGQQKIQNSAAKAFYNSVGEELVPEGQEDDLRKLYFPFEKSTWERYTLFCRKTCPLWICNTHNEKISMILKMAEKCYASMISQKAEVREHSNENVDNDQEFIEFVRYADAIPSTPERATVPTSRNAPSTPRKNRKEQEISDKSKVDTRKSNHQQHAQELEDLQASPRPEKCSANQQGGHGQTSVVTSPEKPLVIEQVRSLSTAVTSFEEPILAAKNEQSEPFRADIQPQTLQTEPMESIEVGMEASLWEKYSSFFDRHGWGARPDLEKLAILLEIAENREIVSIGNVESRRKRIEEAVSVSKCLSLGQIESIDPVSVWDNSLNSVPMSGLFTLKIAMPQSLWQRYSNFFGTIGQASCTHYEKFKMLIGRGEAFLDLGLTSDSAGSALAEAYEMPREWTDGPLRTKGRPGPSRDDLSEPFLIWLSRDTRRKYREFFEKRSLAAETDEKKMLTLLDMAENPKPLPLKSSGMDQVGKHKQTGVSSMVRNRSKRVVDDDAKSVASDGTWDDEAETFARLGDDLEPFEDDSQARSDHPDLDKTKSVSLRLLKPGYYLKFSEEARSTKDPVSKRSVAALANTRRHIVERPQLKQLIAQCACTNPKCTQRIKKDSIVIKEYGWTIRVIAHCQAEKKHTFNWASSAKAPHKAKSSSLLYTLNTVIPAAVQLSGNNIAKMEHFSQILRLTWGVGRISRPALQVCKKVTHKCFEMTQQEMLENLKNETGEIVLAGDGQFDSPGSCATLCTYTLMALGVDEQQDDGSRLLKRCEYVISQAVIDRRHADNKSVNMERVGLHWALQPIIRAGIKVAELATDDHIQITTDFKKIAAAAEERKSNAAQGSTNRNSLMAFKDLLSTALLYYHPAEDVDGRIISLLSFYARIVHSNDIWHRAKNLLKSISSIAQGAAKEQQTYKKYAKMLRNYLWECAKQAQGSKEKFLELWIAVKNHLHDNHEDCNAINLHSKTKLMQNLDQKTRSFALLIQCLRRVEASAPQLCRFRNTGVLEAYNGLTLKYCPKRIHFTYDTMVMRRDLAALDHNHHVIRSVKRNKDGTARVKTIWKKSTKAVSSSFCKEVKDYKYIGHIMAAILAARCDADCSYANPAKLSAAHPWRIYPNLGAAAAATNPTSGKVPMPKARAKSQQQAPKAPGTAIKAITKRKQRKRISSSSSSASTPSQSSGSEEESDSFGTSSRRAVKPKRRKRLSSDSDWEPETSEGTSSTRKKGRMESLCGGKAEAETANQKMTIGIPDQQSLVRCDNEDDEQVQKMVTGQNFLYEEPEPSTSWAETRQHRKSLVGPENELTSGSGTMPVCIESDQQELELSDNEGTPIWGVESGSDEGSDDF